MIPLARIAVWALSLGAVVLIALILGGSDDLQEKVGAAALLFVLFSLNSLSGFFLIERRPELTLLGASAIGFSVAAYFVVLDAFFSRGFFPGQDSVWILMIIAFVLGQASLLLSFRRDEDSPLVNAVLAGALIVLALLVVLASSQSLAPTSDPRRTRFSPFSTSSARCSHRACAGRKPKRPRSRNGVVYNACAGVA